MLNNRQSSVLLAVFVLIFFLISLKGLKTVQPGDENVYYYMGKLVSGGKTPYRDFFYAHPPLHIYALSLVYRLFGFSIVAFKLIPLLSTLVTAFFAFKIAQKFGNFEATLASMLFLFGYSVMFNSVFSFGIEMAAMLLVIGVYLMFDRGYYLVAGLFFGLSAVTRLLSLVPTIAILVFIFFQDKKNFLKLSSGFLIVFLAVNGVFFLLAGNSYFSNAYGYHIQKNFGGEENFREYFDILKINWLLFFSAFLLVFVRDKRPMLLFGLVSTAYLLFLTALKKIFGFYFLIVFPFLAIIGGYSTMSLAKGLPKKWKIAVFLVFALAFAWNLSSDALFLQKVGFSGFDRGKEITDFVALNSNKETLLFGDESAAPLIALETGKNIALDLVDTNDQVFTSGMKDIKKTLDKLKGLDILFIVRSSQGISILSETREFLNRDCTLLSRFHDKIEGDYLVYRCNQ